MKQFVLTIAYDGTDYLGWQKTKMGRSIEETLCQVAEQIVQQPISLQAASRTDAGVHALGQVVSFHSAKEISCDKLQTGLNALLPPDIRVRELCTAPLHFHPTLDATGKEYSYEISLGKIQLPHRRRVAWHVYAHLDLETMKGACAQLLGQSDFSSLCNQRKSQDYASHICNIEECSIQTTEDGLRLVLRADRFLYRMARNIVGTLIDIARGKLATDSLSSILREGQRALAGVTAPAHGLSLQRVSYAVALPGDRVLLPLSLELPFSLGGR